MRHFINDRDALMRIYRLDRKVATLALRLAKGIDTFKILVACEGFHGVPLITQEEFESIQECLLVEKT